MIKEILCNFSIKITCSYNETSWDNASLFSIGDKLWVTKGRWVVVVSKSPNMGSCTSRVYLSSWWSSCLENMKNKCTWFRCLLHISTNLESTKLRILWKIVNLKTQNLPFCKYAFYACNQSAKILKNDLTNDLKNEMKKTK